MLPVLLHVGPVTIYSLGVFLILSWCVFSFLFWRMLRANGVDEDKIFDLTFYSTLLAFVISRAAFVAGNWPLFADTWLRIVALWIQPGLSLYGAFVGALLALVFLSRREKVRLGHVLDAFALSYPGALMIGLIGAFLDGTVAGKIANLPWALRVVGHIGRRHPVELYEIIALVFMMIALSYLDGRSAKEKWPYGVVGVWFFIMYTVSMFGLEFFKESRVYWSLSANQWILVALFAESVGAFYVRGGGREMIRPMVVKIKTLPARIGGVYMQSFPSDVLNDLRKHLEEEKKRTGDRVRELSAQDPFSDPDRVNDNAASDSEASEESSHDRFAAMVEELNARLADIDAALGRIADGSYGFCTNCKQMIDTDRLAILPTATLCSSCEHTKKSVVQVK